MNHLIHRKPQRRLVPFVLVSLASLAVFSGLYLSQRPVPAQASGGYLSLVESRYSGFLGSRLDTCSLCHTSSIPNLNPYGTAFLNAGRNAAALGTIEGLDSDKDGFTNLQEINAQKFPGDPNDRPVAPTATATKPPTPTNTATTPPTPTKTATKPPTATNTATKPPTPTNTATPLPSNTPTQPPAPTNTVTAFPPPTKTSTPLPPSTATATKPPQSTATNPPPATATQPLTPTAAPTKPVQPTATAPAPTATQPPVPPASIQAIRLNPSADAFVTKSKKWQNFGGDATLQVSSSPMTRSYLRFNLPDLEDTSVQKATLSLFVENGSGDGFSVYTVRTSRWTENKIVFQNAPVIRRMIASGNGAAGAWVTIDLTSSLPDEGSITLALVAKDGAAFSFGSRESGEHAPVLAIVTGQDSSDDD